MREKLVAGEIECAEIGDKTEGHLRSQDDPMPTMEAQVQRVHFAESEEEHEEDEPRQNGAEGNQPFVAHGADEHRKPEGVTIEDRF